MVPCRLETKAAVMTVAGPDRASRKLGHSYLDKSEYWNVGV